MSPQPPATLVASAMADTESSHLLERRLPSGRSLALRTDGGSEELEIRSARGEVEVRIVLTDAGPLVTLRGARLLMDAPEVAVRCRSFDVQASESLRLRSQGETLLEADELRARTEHDIHMNGAHIRLNCTPDSMRNKP